MIEISHLVKHFGKQRVLDDITFDVKNAEICAVVGSSGSGKSTLLSILCGLEHQDEGSIVINGVTVASDSVFLPPEKRKVGIVFQDFALFPHLNVRKNIAFGKVDASRSHFSVEEVARMTSTTHLLDKYVHQLSGGEQQRVAMARALYPSPEVLLLDEPFSSLDDLKKSSVRTEVFEAVRAAGVTCLFVTHDIRDAMFVADSIALLHESKLLQHGSVHSLYHQPVSTEVASLFGEFNVLDGNTARILGVGELSQTTIVRPEHLRLTPQDSSTQANCCVKGAVFLGKEIRYELTALGPTAGSAQHTSLICLMSSSAPASSLQTGDKAVVQLSGPVINIP